MDQEKGYIKFDCVTSSVEVPGKSYQNNSCLLSKKLRNFNTIKIFYSLDFLATEFHEFEYVNFTTYDSFINQKSIL
jgi:hypothetical protein